MSGLLTSVNIAPVKVLKAGKPKTPPISAAGRLGDHWLLARARKQAGKALTLRAGLRARVCSTIDCAETQNTAETTFQPITAAGRLGDHWLFAEPELKQAKPYT